MKITFDIPDSTIVATLLFIFEDENNDMDIATLGVRGDELRDGAVLVWCQSEHRPGGEGWYLVDGSAKRPHDFIAFGRERSIPCAGISTGFWLAYRRPPEGGED